MGENHKWSNYQFAQNQIENTSTSLYLECIQLKKKRKNKRQKRKLDKQERNNDLQIHQIITNVMLFKYSAK